MAALPASDGADSDYGSDLEDLEDEQLDAFFNATPFELGGEPVILQDLEGDERTPSVRIPSASQTVARPSQGIASVAANPQIQRNGTEGHQDPGMHAAGLD